MKQTAFGIAIKGSADFVFAIEQALQLLSQVRCFGDDFLKVVDCVKQSRFLRFDACMGIRRGKGCIWIRNGVDCSIVQLSLLLSHEAQHNVLFHQYLEQYGYVAAIRNYYRSFAAIERQCIEHELLIGEELGLSYEELSQKKAYLAIIPHHHYLREQLKCLSRIRRAVAKSQPPSRE